MYDIENEIKNINFHYTTGIYDKSNTPLALFPELNQLNSTVLETLSRFWNYQSNIYRK